MQISKNVTEDAAPAVPLDPSRIAFGKTFSPHFFVAEYRDGGWTQARIAPLEAFSLHPGALVLHYGPWQQKVTTSLDSRPILIPLIVTTVAMISLFWQHQKHGLIGHEGAPAVALQCHLDMVCQKNSGTEMKK